MPRKTQCLGEILSLAAIKLGMGWLPLLRDTFRIAHSVAMGRINLLHIYLLYEI